MAKASASYAEKVLNLFEEPLQPSALSASTS